jgi:hypothetical protein
MAKIWSELMSQQSAELLRSVARRIVLRGSEMETEVDLEALALRAFILGADDQPISTAKLELSGVAVIATAPPPNQVE